MVLTAPKDIQEVENYLLLKAMVAWEAKHETVQLLLMLLLLNMSKVAEVKEEGERKEFCEC
jgi:hypothetical protein